MLRTVQTLKRGEIDMHAQRVLTAPFNMESRLTLDDIGHVRGLLTTYEVWVSPSSNVEFDAGHLKLNS